MTVAWDNFQHLNPPTGGKGLAPPLPAAAAGRNAAKCAKVAPAHPAVAQHLYQRWPMPCLEVPLLCTGQEPGAGAGGGLCYVVLVVLCRGAACGPAAWLLGFRGAAECPAGV